MDGKEVSPFSFSFYLLDMVPLPGHPPRDRVLQSQQNAEKIKVSLQNVSDIYNERSKNKKRKSQMGIYFTSTRRRRSECIEGIT